MSSTNAKKLNGGEGAAGTGQGDRAMTLSSEKVLKMGEELWVGNENEEGKAENGQQGHVGITEVNGRQERVSIMEVDVQGRIAMC